MVYKKNDRNNILKEINNEKIFLIKIIIFIYSANSKLKIFYNIFMYLFKLFKNVA